MATRSLVSRSLQSVLTQGVNPTNLPHPLSLEAEHYQECYSEINGKPDDVAIMFCAAKKGYTTLVKYLHDFGIPYLDIYLKTAVIHGQKDMVIFLLNQLSINPFILKLHELALIKNNFELFQYLQEKYPLNKSQLSELMFQYGIGPQNLKVVDYFYNLSGTFRDMNLSLVDIISMSKDLDFVRHVIELDKDHSLDYDQGLREALSLKYDEIVLFLLKYVPINEQMIDNYTTDSYYRNYLRNYIR